MSTATVGNETRLATLRETLAEDGVVRIFEVHSPLSAIVAEHARGKGAEQRAFHGFWSSSLTDSALRGLPDTELLDLHLRLSWIDQIFAVTSLPLVMDGDTGGKTDHFEHAVRAMERHGVSAVVIEDKSGDKRNSLLDGENLHTMAPVDDFCDKIRRGKASQLTSHFMIIARLEGLITGLPRQEILDRAAAYVAAGADGLVIHSRDADETMVLDLARELRARHPKTPLIAIPTAYPTVTEEELHAAGFNLIIYANHMLRAATQAMEEVSHRILDNSRALEAEELCIATSKLLTMPDDKRPIVRAPRV
ncbi:MULTISPECIES: phosphoenolpyruvate mutase [unclassified Streptomyces]|uniref:phosphoenolpyruvate mutase n=1 Tax=unclassified Streptomyces TaxID=2593676 RepID=UPI00225372E1|nr:MULTISPECIES: phosphoenolpyruvate mutase [unclassified Streptomyces]WSP57221.1 phosphoenolpyruvate mutase [Streptomyces sp. NBC_01241]WSU22061.1 phosphoenolpyruvate mutase [Streptomyces sp. NBC_01108]MCX4789033.1 phosphoenolpyruvate mutase [Streptomyces sp. NBC_01221]MCX4795221.1 phosphoenolpyruvate mutase [Streptomyces sp. NBC_01242]WSJ36534.1 phosphoenolpyruvate mutase [Streptomyces sp. NBC_01321]